MKISIEHDPGMAIPYGQWTIMTHEDDGMVVATYPNLKATEAVSRVAELISLADTKALGLGDVE